MAKLNFQYHYSSLWCHMILQKYADLMLKKHFIVNNVESSSLILLWKQLYFSQYFLRNRTFFNVKISMVAFDQNAFLLNKIINFIRLSFSEAWAAFATIGPNGSKNCQERFQLYFHVSLVRRGTITNRSRPGILGTVRQPCWAVLVCVTSPLRICHLAASFSVAC